MAQVLLTHSYMLCSDPKQQKLGQPYAPLGTLYAAAVLKDQGADLAFHDMTFARGPEDLAPALDRHRPEVVVIYEDGFSYLSKMCLTNVREACFKMTRLAKERKATVIICSPDSTDQHEMYLQRGADVVIIGEGEITLTEVIAVIRPGGRNGLQEIEGISWKVPGGIRVNPPRPLNSTLDDLPFPAWELLDMEQYRHAWRRRNGYFHLNMVTTRGCPYHCAWCAKPVYGNHYSSRSPGNVVEEMAYLRERFSPDGIWFADDIFGLRPGWVDEFESEVRKAGFILPYTIQTRVDLLLGEQQIRPLAQSGCRKAWLGIESGSQKVLDSMEKGTTVAQAREVSPKLREAGIEQAFFLQLGFPGETREDITATIRLLKDLLPDDIGISVTYPLPGTKFYESVRKELERKANWTDSDDLALLFRGRFTPSFYKNMHRYIHKYYRLVQGIHYLKEAFIHPTTLTRTRFRRMILTPYYGCFALLYKLLLTLHGNGGKGTV